MFALFFSLHQATEAATYTVCSPVSTCDFVSLYDALASSLVSGDTITLTSAYIFDPVAEGTSLGATDITISCEAGADTFGDSAESNVSLNLNANTTLQNCTLDNVNINASSNNNIKILGNTFTGTASYQVLLNNADTFEISNNIGIGSITIGNSDNGTISGNTLECHNSNSCIYVTGVGPITDYSDPAQIPVGIDITDNTITNYSTNTYGDWINITAGDDITISGNTIKSSVTTENHYVTMVSLQNSNVDFNHNTLIMPEKDAPSNEASVGINFRGGEASRTLTVDHNSIIYGPQTSLLNNGTACIGFFDDNSHPLVTTTLSVNYNLCYNGTGTVGGYGVVFGINVSTNDLTFTNSYNGFYGLQTNFNDNNNSVALTTADSTTVTTDPIFRLENASTTDDYELSPISGYFDANGTLDIGAESAVRVSTYTIDSSCTVDYTTCYSKLTSILASVMQDDDEITIGPSTYTPFAIPSGLNNITLQGTGTSTIIDATGVPQGFTFDSLTNSEVKNFTIENATTETFVYNMFSNPMKAGGVDYDDLSGPPQYVTAIFVADAACNPNQNIYITSPYVDVTGVNGIGTSNVGLYLIHIPPAPFSPEFLTVFIPNSIASNPSEVQTNCGTPSTYFDYFVPNVFVLQPDGTYTYDAAAVANAGITMLGTGSAPYLTKIINHDAGIYLNDSSNNTFSNIIFEGNLDDVYFDGTSSNNTFTTIEYSSDDSHGDEIPAKKKSKSSGSCPPATCKLNPFTPTVPVVPTVPSPLVATPTVVAPVVTTPAKSLYVSKLINLPRNLKLGVRGTDVQDLQRFLNEQGFILTELGPGSPGNETMLFGNLTRLALARFQFTHNIRPVDGAFGPITKKAIGGL